MEGWGLLLGKLSLLIFYVYNLKLSGYSENKLNDGRNDLIFSFPGISEGGAAAPFALTLKYAPD